MSLCRSGIGKLVGQFVSLQRSVIGKLVGHFVSLQRSLIGKLVGQFVVLKEAKWKSQSLNVTTSSQQQTVLALCRH